MSDPNDLDGEPVPKLPRGRGLKLSAPDIVRILITLMTLIGVIVLTKPCANSVSKFVTDMDKNGSGSAAAAKQMPHPGTVDEPTQYETLRPGMTEAEIKAAIERSKAAAAAREAAGSAATGSAGSAGSNKPAVTP